MQKYNIISKITLIVLLAIGICCSCLFYFGGNEAQGLEVAGDTLSIPVFTNLFLSWNYFLVAIVCCITLCVVIWEFIKTMQISKKQALKQFTVVLCFVFLVMLCWFLGSEEEVNIIGYEGADNFGFMARLSDACLYLTYILICSTVVVLLCGVWYTKHVK